MIDVMIPFPVGPLESSILHVVNLGGRGEGYHSLAWMFEI